MSKKPNQVKPTDKPPDPKITKAKTLELVKTTTAGSATKTPPGRKEKQIDGNLLTAKSIGSD